MINELELSRLWQTILSGGPIMIPLAVLALLLYRKVIGLLCYVSRFKIQDELERISPSQTHESIATFREKLKSIIANQLKYANVLIVAAPLLGLLGTVIGMLETFKGIGAESSLDTTQAVADGVKVALITTQTGLMISIVGIFFTQLVSRIFGRIENQLSELEMLAMKQSIGK
ncbi:MotA/TolQ/ExbB proton channel family protein [Pelagicoccus sp. SDUM812002]|uniref:MotA/TolQ/ExbB proton channel family protein n=1 Tax=Pelagicoccus sp. SDUM812002 TaxID=3041266 RepID=UPI00280E7539|nr:MotA/TolQ/ExbB proton channel family protein [Pelagicoccus sp. SDUM812002]MDQ8186337.1 MotA/TolQ/ExbB proton channel family protein [Pelagicoccus sp. SDUM812002]